MQFLVVARDGTDEEAVERRRRVRPEHLASIQPLIVVGHVLIGGAILSEAGDMVGSMLLVEFGDRAELDRWISADPYVTEGVWRQIDVAPFRSAVGAWQPSTGDVSR
jgi:uncharacterized protein YciI